MSRAGGSRLRASHTGASHNAATRTPKSRTQVSASSRKRTGQATGLGISPVSGSLASQSILTPLSGSLEGASDFGDDDDLLTQRTAMTGVQPRETYQPPAGYYSQHLAQFQTYLQRTQVQKLFQRLLQLLLDRPELPYNPYPGFYNRLRMNMEIFHMENKPTYEITRKLENKLKSTYIANLYTVSGSESVWGLKSMLSVINVDALERYRWLIEDVTPELDQLYTTDEYSNQVMVALIGPSVFHGSFFPSSHFVQLRLEYLITGPDVSQGISIFVNSLMSEIDAMFQSEHHFLLGVKVPTPDPDNPDLWEEVDWETDTIQEEKATFLQHLSDAVIGNKYIYVECIFLMNPDYPSYVKGEKQYGFNFVETIEEMREDGIASFCEMPMASLHEGVFLDRAHAETYVSLYQPQIQGFDHAKEEEAGFESPVSPDTQSLQQDAWVPMGISRVATARSSNRRFSMSQEQEVNSVLKHVHGRLKHIKPRRVKIDGFRYGEDTSSGPYSWQITTPIKSKYQMSIASYWREAEVFDIVYCLIILVLLDKEVFGDHVLVELYRALHGTAGQLHLLMEFNKGLRSTVQALANTNEYTMIKPLLLQYKDAIHAVFHNPLVEMSQDHVTVGTAIIARVDNMITTDADFASAAHLHITLRDLKNINLYCLPLMLELAEDVLSRCPNLVKQIQNFQECFPDKDPRPATRYVRKKEPVVAGSQIGEMIHGVEDEHIKRHETSVLNMDTCIERDMAPQLITRESVLIRYMIDCHLDDVWRDYLTDLAGGDVFPPNPFPRLISAFRCAAMKMDLFYEKSSVVADRLYNTEVKLEDQDNFVYTVPGLDAHGTLPALTMLDTGAYSTIHQIFRMFQQRSYIQKKGPYRVGICLALSGPTVWYGRMQPYLNEIELHEHYYIQGPAQSQSQAVQLCAVIVHTHMFDMITKSGLPVMGVYFGSPSPNHWTPDDILHKKKGFLSEFSRTAGAKLPIYAKAYVVLDGWRYVTLIKRFLLHFLEDGASPELFYPEDPLAFYQSIFLSKERASFHYQNGGPTQGGDPLNLVNQRAVTACCEKQMADDKRRCDWLSFYRHLLLRDLVSQSQTYIADTWRMFHSMAGQVEYVIAMMDGLQDIVLTSLQTQTTDKPTGSRQSKQSKQAKRNPVDQKILSKMVTAFYQKLMYVCEARLTMSSKHLADYIEGKLKCALEFEPDSGQPFLAIEDETLFRLEEMKSMMRILQDILSSDVQSVCQDVALPTVQAPLRTPQMETPSQRSPSQRPPSTAASMRQTYGPKKGARDPYLSQPESGERPASQIDDTDFFYKNHPQMMTIPE